MIDGSIYYDGKIHLAEKEILLLLLKGSEAGKFSMNQEKYFEEKGEDLDI